MNFPVAPNRPPLSRAAMETAPAAKSEPLVRVEWRRVLFFQFEVDPAVVRMNLPAEFDLELHDGKAVISVVALTMRRFRRHAAGPFWARAFGALGEQRFLNLRTYVRHRGESGAFFFWSWLSRPWNLPLAGRPLGLTCEFATTCYRHEHERGHLQGTVTATERRFTYRARIEPDEVSASCPSGSLAEFALERYAGFFWYRGAGRVFRVGHPAWLQAPVTATIEDSLIVRKFPWFERARFMGAQYAPGFDDVWIGRPQQLDQLCAPWRMPGAFGEKRREPTHAL